MDPGERLTFQERRLRLLLAHLAGRAVRARVELDDLLQEVFLRVLDSSRGLPAPEAGPEENDTALWRLLAHVARQVVIDVARALRAQKRCGSEQPLARSDWSRAGAGEPRAREAGPGTRAAGAEASRHLTQAFLALPGEYRRVIGLRQFEGLSARDAAARLGRSETAVHSLYRRALAAWEESAGRARTSRDESGRAPRLEGA